MDDKSLPNLPPKPANQTAPPPPNGGPAAAPLLTELQPIDNSAAASTPPAPASVSNQSNSTPAGTLQTKAPPPPSVRQAPPASGLAPLPSVPASEISNKPTTFKLPSAEIDDQGSGGNTFFYVLLVALILSLLANAIFGYTAFTAVNRLQEAQDLLADTQTEDDTQTDDTTSDSNQETNQNQNQSATGSDDGITYTQAEYKTESENLKAEGVYPIISVDGVEAEFINDIVVANFVEKIGTEYGMEESEENVDISFDYEIYTSVDRYISVAFDITVRMLDSNRNLKALTTFNFDLQEQKQISLLDIFADGSEQVNSDTLAQKAREELGLKVDGSMNDQIGELTIEDFMNNWYINDQVLSLGVTLEISSTENRQYRVDIPIMEIPGLDL